MILDAIAELMDIKSKSEQEELHFNVPFASEQESAEGVVLLQNSKCTLYLNGAIDLDFPESALALVAFAEMRTPLTGFYQFPYRIVLRDFYSQFYR